MNSNEFRISMSIALFIGFLCLVLIGFVILSKPIVPVEMPVAAQSEVQVDNENVINPPSFARVFDALAEQDDICFINGIPQIVDIGGVGDSNYFITYLNNDGDIVTLSYNWIAILSPNRDARYVTDLGNNEVECDNVNNDQ